VGVKRVIEVRGSTPAKVNLSLLVGPLRPDGYHDLFTVFANVDLYDQVDCLLSLHPPGEPSAGLDVDCEGVSPQDNLVARAFQLLSSETGWSFGGEVKVTKRIPIGAGLGGGSSDAACALRLGALSLTRAGGPVVDVPGLRRLALRLGADVPYFLSPGPAIGTGVGERLAPLDLPSLPLVVILPQEELLTAEVYRTFDGVAAREAAEDWTTRRDLAEIAWRNLSHAWGSAPGDCEGLRLQLAGLLQNDLERAAFHLLPELPLLKARLEKQGVLGGLLSGSGPTIFGVCSTHSEAAAAALELQREGLPARACTAAGAVPVS
jgi:4-diphosphocytidyl-2-C-methyl-D-erythritol kinase